MYFKVALRMCAGGTQLGCVRTDDDMTAVAAFPYLNLALCKDSGGFDVLEQRAVAFLVVAFDGGNETELGSKLGKAFFFRVLCKAVIHVGPLVVFAFCRMEQVFSGVTDAGKLLEPQLCVFLFVVGGLQKQRGDLLIPYILWVTFAAYLNLGIYLLN